MKVWMPRTSTSFFYAPSQPVTTDPKADKASYGSIQTMCDVSRGYRNSQPASQARRRLPMHLIFQIRIHDIGPTEFRLNVFVLYCLYIVCVSEIDKPLPFGLWWWLMLPLCHRGPSIVSKIFLRFADSLLGCLAVMLVFALSGGWLTHVFTHMLLDLDVLYTCIFTCTYICQPAWQPRLRSSPN